MTNGSAEGIRYIIEGYTRPNGKIVSVEPSYAMYKVYAEMYGRQHVSVKYNNDLTIDVQAIINEINSDVDLLILLNPNNPIGNIYTYNEMDLIIEAAVSNEVTVLIDQAYYYFYPKSFIKYALENKNVFLTRTFSKLFSLAGCRLGYVVGEASGIKMIQKLCTPHNVNAFGILFAQSIIEEKGLIESLVDEALEGKQFLIKTLKEYGYKINAGEGNFIFIEAKHDADEIVKKMKNEEKILIKAYNGIKGMSNCLRVTTGDKATMSRFIDALLRVDV